MDPLGLKVILIPHRYAFQPLYLFVDDRASVPTLTPSEPLRRRSADPAPEHAGADHAPRQRLTNP
jgi:hypothetical protein